MVYKGPSDLLILSDVEYEVKFWAKTRDQSERVIVGYNDRLPVAKYRCGPCNISAKMSDHPTSLSKFLLSMDASMYA